MASEFDGLGQGGGGSGEYGNIGGGSSKAQEKTEGEKLLDEFREKQQALREIIDKYEMDIVDLKQNISDKKEDLDKKSDDLVNNLQMLKAVDAKLKVQKNKLRDVSQYDTSGSDMNVDSEEAMNLDRLLYLSKKPWERSEEGLQQPRNNRDFQQAMLAELSKLTADIHALNEKLADPFSADRLEARRHDASKAGYSETAEMKRKHFQQKNTINKIDVVLDEGERAVVTVGLDDSRTFFSLLEYVTEYWSLDVKKFSLFDAHGVCWPLHGKVKETLASLPENVEVVYLRKSDGSNPKRNGVEGFEGDESGYKDKEFDPRGLADEGDYNKADGNGNEDDENDDEEISTKEKSVRFLEDVNVEGTHWSPGHDGSKTESKLDKQIERETLSNQYHRGYRYSLKIARFHCETFFYILLLTLVFNYSFFSKGVFDSSPMRKAIESALIETPFGACDSCSLEEAKIIFAEIDSTNALFSFLQGPVADLLTVPDDPNDNVDLAYSRFPFIQDYNIVVGKVLLQQLRVQPQCEGGASGLTSSTECYPAFVDGKPSQESYGGPFVDCGNLCEQAFIFKEEPYSGASNLWPGFVSDLVTGVGDRFNVNEGGFYWKMGQLEGDFDDETDQLISNDWIDSQARAVYMVVNFYNPNLDLFMVMMAQFQFTTSNAIVPRVIMAPARLQTGFFATSGSDADTVTNTMLIIAISLYIVFLVLFVVDFFSAKSKRQFLRRPRSLVDIVLFILVVTSISLGYSEMRTMGGVIEQVQAQLQLEPGAGGTEYVELRGVAFGLAARRALEAAVQVFLVLKGIGYLVMNPQISFLGKTFVSSVSMLNNFAFIFVIFLFAFAAVGHFTIGRDEFIFHSYDLSLFSSLQAMVGMFNLNSLSSVGATKVWPVLLSFFMYLFGFLALYRIFIAIVAFYYSKDMDQVRRKGYYWLPSVNQEYKMVAPHEQKYLSKLQLTNRFGLKQD